MSKEHGNNKTPYTPEYESHCLSYWCGHSEQWYILDTAIADGFLERRMNELCPKCQAKKNKKPPTAYGRYLYEKRMATLKDACQLDLLRAEIAEEKDKEDA